MDIGSLLLGLALLLLVAAFVARPLVERASARTEEAGPAAPLLVERDNVLAALRDLDFDYTTGKIESADYQGQRAKLVRQGVNVLRQLDALGITDGQPQTLDDEIEAAIAAQRSAPEDEIEAAIAAHRGAADGHRPPPEPSPAKAGARPRFCPQCGTRAEPADRFCSRCGARLPAPVEAS